MIDYINFGYITIIVDNIKQASSFYQKAFDAKLIDTFPHFKNIGYAKSAGLLEKPETLEVSIVYLSISNLFVELHQLHAPARLITTNFIKKDTTITLRVNNIDKAFKHIKNQSGIELINKSESYKPFRLSNVTAKEFHFYDEKQEKDESNKKQIAQRISKIKYFKFFDKYGMQWAFVERSN